MGVISIFRKLVYAQVILGIVAWSVAEQNPAMVLIAGAVSTLSWYVVEGPGGRPLPRWLINIGVLIVTAWMFYTQVNLKMPLIIALGEFIMAIQLLKLYEGKKNRDYAQLIVLSLMEIVCASIISAEIVYGVLLVVYLIVALFTIVLFQLKLGYDEVVRQNATAAGPDEYVPRPRTVVSRGHRRHFRVSALTCGVSSVLISAMVFITLPRGQASGFMGDWDFPARGSVSGFDTQVQLTGGIRLGTSRAPVMNVQLRKNGEIVGSREASFLLRGAVLDTYNPASGRWLRGPNLSRADLVMNSADAPLRLAAEVPERRHLTELDVTLRAQTKGILFSLYAPAEVISVTQPLLTFNRRDHILSVRQSGGNLQYRLRCQPEGVEPGNPAPVNGSPWREYATSPVVPGERVQRLTHQILREAGLHRDRGAEVSPNDQAIAQVLERYLRTQYEYTLDLPPVPKGTGPLSAFLFQHKRGHCEYFASAMVAMLRSVGIRARLITGFRASEFNAVGGYYVVRQRNAHAWVESWTEQGWRTYDPSPPAAIEALHPSGGWFAMLRDFYDYVEFHWINNVITYDADQRETVVGQLDASMGQMGQTTRAYWMELVEWFRTFPQRWTLGPWGYLLLGLVVTMIALGVFLFVQILMHRYRTVRQLQLEPLSRREKRRLTTHLTFYLQMLKIVEKAGHSKPLWQTPASFAERLTRLDPERFAGVVPLTDLFYEIRFGGRPLDSTRSRLIQEHLDRLRSLS